MPERDWASSTTVESLHATIRGLNFASMRATEFETAEAHPTLAKLTGPRVDALPADTD